MARKNQKSNKSSARKVAIEYGIDMSLIYANLKKSPEQRIRDINDAWLGILQLRKGLKHDKTSN